MAGNRFGQRKRKFFEPGARVGDWIVLGVERTESGGSEAWHYRCECQHCWTEYLVYCNNIETGKSTCCVQCAVVVRNATGWALYGRLGIDSRHVNRLSNRFYAMRSRCVGGTRPNPAYAGRGIECRFESAQDFVEHAITVPGWDNPRYQTDRIDNDGHYEPGNIRFVPGAVNARNKRDNVVVEYLGEVMVAEDFHKRFCPRYRDVSTVSRKIKAGKSPEQVIADQALCRGEYLRCTQRRAKKQVRDTD